MNGAEKSAQRGMHKGEPHIVNRKSKMCDSLLDSACIAFDGNPVLEQPHLLPRYVNPRPTMSKVSTCESTKKKTRGYLRQ